MSADEVSVLRAALLESREQVSAVHADLRPSPLEAPHTPGRSHEILRRPLGKSRLSLLASTRHSAALHYPFLLLDQGGCFDG